MPTTVPTFIEQLKNVGRESKYPQLDDNFKLKTIDERARFVFGSTSGSFE